MIEELINFFKQPSETTKTETPDGLCPSCWGYQEYDDKIRELYKDKQIDVNNHKANYSFVKEFIITHVDGIKLVKGNNSLECPTCRLKI